MTDIFFRICTFFFPSSPVSRQCKRRRPNTWPLLQVVRTHTALFRLTAQRIQDDDQTQLVTSSDQGHSSLSRHTKPDAHTRRRHTLPTDFKAHWGKQRRNKGTERGLIPECGGPKHRRGKGEHPLLWPHAEATGWLAGEVESVSITGQKHQRK